MATNPEEILDVDPGTIEGAAALLKADREQAAPEAAENSEDLEEAEDIEEIDPATEVLEEEPAPTEQASEEYEDELVDEEEFAPTFEPPNSWGDEEARSTFSELPEDVQRRIVETDKAVTRGVNKKLQEAANIRKQFESKTQEAEQVAAELRQRLESLAGQETVELPSESLLDDTSDDYDPDKYHREFARYTRNQESKKQQVEELRKLQDAENLKKAQAQAQNIQRAQETLLHRFPSWKDPEKGAEAINGIRSYLVKQGIPQDVADNVYDADMITIAWKARRFDEIRAKEKVVKKTVRTSRPTSRATTTKKPDNVQKLQSSLKESGSVHDAAALLKATRS